MIISVHLPKTAGTSFRSYLDQVFPNRVRSDYLGMYAVEDPIPPTLSRRFHRARVRVYHLRNLRHSPRSDDEVVHGHFLATKYLEKYPDAELVTWVRHPVERTISHYFHWQRDPDPGNAISVQVARGEISLEEFAQLESVRNLQSQYLAGVPLSRFSFIGSTEHFEEDVYRFATQFGLDVPIVPRANCNPQSVQVSPSLRSHLLEMNGEDVCLYDEMIALRTRALK